MEKKIILTWLLLLVVSTSWAQSEPQIIITGNKITIQQDSSAKKVLLIPFKNFKRGTDGSWIEKDLYHLWGTKDGLFIRFLVNIESPEKVTLINGLSVKYLKTELGTTVFSYNITKKKKVPG